MKHAILSVFAGALLLTGTAHGADLDWNGGGGSTLYSGTSAFQWGGFYAGVNGGYAWGTAEREPAAGGPSTEDNTGGFALGAQAGYNFDMGGFVLGAETDLQWAAISHDEDIPGGTLTAGVDGFGTVRGRAGVTFDRVMPYITGGLAYGWGTVSVEDGAGVKTSQDNTHVGWTVGAGLEAAAADNITFKAEFLYVDLGAQTYTSAPGPALDVSQRFGIVRAGLNYKF